MKLYILSGDVCLLSQNGNQLWLCKKKGKGLLYWEGE